MFEEHELFRRVTSERLVPGGMGAGLIGVPGRRLQIINRCTRPMIMHPTGGNSDARPSCVFLRFSDGCQVIPVNEDTMFIPPPRRSHVVLDVLVG